MTSKKRLFPFWFFWFSVMLVNSYSITLIRGEDLAWCFSFGKCSRPQGTCVPSGFTSACVTLGWVQFWGDDASDKVLASSGGQLGQIQLQCWEKFQVEFPQYPCWLLSAGSCGFCIWLWLEAYPSRAYLENSVDFSQWLRNSRHLLSSWDP